MDKITAFEVISYSAIKYADLQDDTENFPKSFPKMLDKLCPSRDQVGVQVYDQEELFKLLNALKTEQSAQALAELLSTSPRTVKRKYLSPLLAAGIITLTIPDKPTSSKQKYKLNIE